MALDKYSEESFDEGAVKPPSQWFKFGKIGDVIKGNLLSVREQDDTYHPGQKQKIYEIEAVGGYFHNIVEKKTSDTPTELKAGDIWQVSGKAIIDKWMRNAEVGQLVIMRYVSDFPMPGGNTAKTVDVKLGAKRAAASEEAPF